MSNVKSTTWLTTKGYLVSWYQGRWHLLEPVGHEWVIMPYCFIRWSDNSLMDGYLTDNRREFNKEEFEKICEALTEAYSQSDQLAHLMNSREIKGSPGSNS